MSVFICQTPLVVFDKLFACSNWLSGLGLGEKVWVGQKNSMEAVGRGKLPAHITDSEQLIRLGKMGRMFWLEASPTSIMRFAAHQHHLLLLYFLNYLTQVTQNHKGSAVSIVSRIMAAETYFPIRYRDNLLSTVA